jgi:hypothetical protein
MHNYFPAVADSGCRTCPIIRRLPTAALGLPDVGQTIPCILGLLGGLWGSNVYEATTSVVRVSYAMSDDQVSSSIMRLADPECRGDLLQSSWQCSAL